MRKSLLSACFGFAVLAGTANANIQIETVPLSGGVVVVLVKGDFEPNDTPTAMIQAAVANNGKVVSFNSNGGSVTAAMAFGRAIRQLGLWTMQLRQAQCASACALAFMGGVQRFADPGSIGVHQASFSNGAAMDGPTAVAQTQAATAMIVSYFVEMGIDPRLLQLSLSTPNSDMRYLTSQEMADYRVTMSTANTQLQPSSPPQPQEQTASTPVAPPPPPPRVDIQSDAIQFVAKIMDEHGQPAESYLAFKASFFADFVNYYGATRQKAEVVDLERKYVERWPIRSGSIRQRSMTASCFEGVCNVGGLYDWKASNPSLHKYSAGTTQFVYRVDMRGSPKIIGQNGNVVGRK